MNAIISARAEDDLAHIYALIFAERPDSALAFQKAAERSISLLASNPEIGPRVIFRTRHKGLRFWPILDFQNYLVYYLIAKDHISIERVLDGRRNVRRVLRSGEF